MASIQHGRVTVRIIFDIYSFHLKISDPARGRHPDGNQRRFRASDESQRGGPSAERLSKGPRGPNHHPARSHSPRKQSIQKQVQIQKGGNVQT